MNQTRELSPIEYMIRTQLVDRGIDDAHVIEAIRRVPRDKFFPRKSAELAYLDLFHTTTPVFTKAYQHDRKLPPEYHQVRKPIYQLYPMINHVHLFGQDYLKQLLAMTDRTASLV